MQHDSSQDGQAIRHVIREITRSWKEKRYDDLGGFLGEQVVIAPPGSDVRIEGREAYIQSYRDYDRAATTLEFVPEEPQIDVLGEIAVAVHPFHVVYELEGKQYRENGRETLVFSRTRGSWVVVWRTLHSEPAAP